MNDKPLDKRRKYYLILDTETATLPFIKKDYAPTNVKKLSIAKPLVYNIAWVVVDRKGRVYRKKDFLITEIFSNFDIFNTAYYASKRPLYLDLLKSKKITLCPWENAIEELIADLSEVTAVGAYNAMFDFKKAIPFTEKYINAFYYGDIFKWLEYQKKSCNNIINGNSTANENFNPDIFYLRDNHYKLFDIWGMACEHLLNTADFKEKAVTNNWYSPSGLFFSTTAETAFKYYSKDMSFSESHTALDDSIIEAKIFSAIIKKRMKNFSIGIDYFPFRKLGTVEEFLMTGI